MSTVDPMLQKPVQTYIETLKWKVLPHSPYFPDIDPSDYYLFRLMIHGPSEQRFTFYEDTKKWVDSWITSKDNSFFRPAIRMLPDRWNKVVASDGHMCPSLAPTSGTVCSQQERVLDFSKTIRDF